MPNHLTTILNSYQIHLILLTSDAAPGDLNTDVKDFKRSVLSHALNFLVKPGPSTYPRPDFLSSLITLHSPTHCLTSSFADLSLSLSLSLVNKISLSLSSLSLSLSLSLYACTHTHIELSLQPSTLTQVAIGCVLPEKQESKRHCENEH